MFKTNFLLSLKFMVKSIRVVLSPNGYPSLNAADLN